MKKLLYLEDSSGNSDALIGKLQDTFAELEILHVSTPHEAAAILDFEKFDFVIVGWDFFSTWARVGAESFIDLVIRKDLPIRVISERPVHRSSFWKIWIPRISNNHVLHFVARCMAMPDSE